MRLSFQAVIACTGHLSPSKVQVLALFWMRMPTINLQTLLVLARVLHGIFVQLKRILSCCAPFPSPLPRALVHHSWTQHLLASIGRQRYSSAFWNFESPRSYRPCLQCRSSGYVFVSTHIAQLMSLSLSIAATLAATSHDTACPPPKCNSP